MIQSVWKNLTGLQKAAEHLWCDFKCRPWDKNSSLDMLNCHIVLSTACEISNTLYYRANLFNYLFTWTNSSVRLKEAF